MGSDVADCAASMVAMRTAARNNVYHNPMAISQTLPALQKTSYLTVKSKQCLDEDGMCCTVFLPYWSLLLQVAFVFFFCLILHVINLLQTLWFWRQLILPWLYQAVSK